LANHHDRRIGRDGCAVRVLDRDARAWEHEQVTTCGTNRELAIGPGWVKAPSVVLPVNSKRDDTAG
jgi:hypothetical protein